MYINCNHPITILPAIFCLLLCALLSLVTVEIAGTVTDQDKQPLAGVVIVIEATTATEPYPEIAPVTNEEGHFTFSNLPAREYTLRASANGYQTQTQKVTVKKRSSVSVAFVLAQNQSSD